MEVAGVPHGLIAWTAQRGSQIETCRAELEHEYVTATGDEGNLKFGPVVTGRTRDALNRVAARAIRARAAAVVDVGLAAVDVAAIAWVMHRDGFFHRRHLLAEARRHLALVLRGRLREPGLDEWIVDASLAARAVTRTRTTASRTGRPRAARAAVPLRPAEGGARTEEGRARRRHRAAHQEADGAPRAHSQDEQSAHQPGSRRSPSAAP
ncbi:hypothetical protein [Streptomyces sp. NBC_01450]|uniref:hypothetical protein n=1 Tax=Streptomyces sp. NBC_01450 TaxID=2903871 RepID=UPI002E311C1E|nr:hypothetical protein [Streptomyces sp. NBC_01450]